MKAKTKKNPVKILTLDIELAPNLATIWSLFNITVGINQLVETSRVLCVSAKWYGSKKTMFFSEWTNGQKGMLKAVHDLLCEADAVIGYNTERFDLPLLQREFIKAGMPPPPPVKHIDLLKVVKKQFRFTSNKLAHVAEQLGLPHKDDVGGHSTWLAVMNGNRQARNRMRAYNIQDVIVTEALYEKLFPWIHTLPNRGLFDTTRPVCPACGSHHIQRRGHTRTKTASYRRFVCLDCKTWSRERTNDLTLAQRKNVLVKC